MSDPPTNEVWVAGAAAVEDRPAARSTITAKDRFIVVDP